MLRNTTSALHEGECSSSSPVRLTFALPVNCRLNITRVDMDASEETKMSCPCRESNHDFLVIHSIVWSLRLENYCSSNLNCRRKEGRKEERKEVYLGLKYSAPFHRT
jgi:hypothetical protein